MADRKLSFTQILLLIFMIMLAVAIISVGIFLVIRTSPAPPATPGALVTNTQSAPSIKLFNITPSDKIYLGECVSIHWQVDGGIKKISISRASETLDPNAPIEGEIQDCPTQTGKYKYQINAIGAGGAKQKGHSITVLARINDTPTPLPLEILNFEADKIEIMKGECVNIFWSVSGRSPSIRITRNQGFIHASDEQSGSFKDCPTSIGSVVYSIEASNTSGELVTTDTWVQVYSPTPTPSTPIGGSWFLVFYLNEQESYSRVITNTLITASFVSDGDLNGSAGCNTYKSNYSEEDAFNLSISEVITTQDFCTSPDGIMEQENQIIILLPLASYYHINDGRLEIFDELGRKILIFSKE